MASAPAPVKELVVLTRNDATTYYLDTSGQPAGLEYDLVTLFAEETGVAVRWQVVQRMSEVQEGLLKGKAQLAVGMARQMPGVEQLRFGPVYQRVTPVVAYAGEMPPVQSLSDLQTQPPRVIAGSAAEGVLLSLKQANPQLAWTAIEEQSAEELLESLADGHTGAVVTESHLLAGMRRFYPELQQGMVLPKPIELAWAYRPDASPAFQKQVAQFFQRIEQNGTLKRLLDRYYGHLHRLQPVDVEAFLQQRLTVLPKYRKWFQDAQVLTGVDWRLLASLGYQESHWNPFAVSPMGVRGLMMLTGETADRMGVTDRSDSKQNIMAGARYLQMLHDDLPPQIGEPDRSWMALAAYNIGIGHLADARMLARMQKLDQNAWTDLKTTLVQLRNPKWVPKTRYGYARGGETVIFVENVRTYYDILSRLEPALELPLLATSTAPAAAP
ncbi:membrane-bound lytic murein transglycosylase MltF [Leeia sp.]|uniref:membrane-bound lytic murein transglycosylase MltF n=1 Tax=Leeia sp. TaxID=2884678 RepID=UPI0035B10495